MEVGNLVNNQANKSKTVMKNLNLRRVARGTFLQTNLIYIAVSESRYEILSKKKMCLLTCTNKQK